MGTSKAFSTRVVLSATTGILLVPKFGDLHRLFDHIYPGIMTLGLASAFPRMAQRMLEQHPGLPDGSVVPPISASGEAFLVAIEPWLVEQEARFGETLDIVHDPMREGPDDLRAAVA